MSDLTKKDDRHTVRTSALQTQQLNELRVRKGLSTMSDVLRYCVEYTLEDESDAIGSRRHFSRTMSSRMDSIEQLVLISAAVQLMATTGSVTNLTNMLEEDSDNPNPPPELDVEDVRMELYKQAVSPELLKVVNAMSSIVKQQRKNLSKPKSKQPPKPKTD